MGGNGTTSLSSMISYKTPTGMANVPKTNMPSLARGNTCDENLCFNGGRCDPLGREPECICKGHFIGMMQSINFNSVFLGN